MTTGNTNQPSLQSIIATQNMNKPKEGPRVIPQQVNWANGTTQSINLQQTMNQSLISLIQGVYIDNSGNSESVSLTLQGTGQVIECGPNAQCWSPMLAPVPCVMIVASNSSAITNFFFCNFPVPAAQWSVAQSAFQFNGSGYAEVSDVALDAEIGANGLNVAPMLLQSGGAGVPEFAGDTCYPVAVSAVGPTNIIAAPGATKAWYLKALSIAISGDAAISGGAAECTVTIKDGATAIFECIASVPAASATGFGATLLQLNDLNLASAALNNALTVTLSVALTSGKIVVNAVGGTSTFIA